VKKVLPRFVTPGQCRLMPIQMMRPEAISPAVW
jgi:hypothetical protein